MGGVWDTNTRPVFKTYGLERRKGHAAAAPAVGVGEGAGEGGGERGGPEADEVKKGDVILCGGGVYNRICQGE